MTERAKWVLKHLMATTQCTLTYTAGFSTSTSMMRPDELRESATGTEMESMDNSVQAVSSLVF